MHSTPRTKSRRRFRQCLLAAFGASAIAACSDGAPPDVDPIGTTQDTVAAAGSSVTAAPLLAQQCLMPTAFGNIDPRRSLAVTDEVILEGFDLHRVMNQIIKTAGGTATPDELFAQWFNFFNADPNQGSSTEDPLPRCSDNDQTVNGFAIQCPRSEGFFGDISNSPFADGAAETFKPIGLFNRLDMAAADGSHCGEYRIVYGKQGGFGRDLLIYEALLPNPAPECGVKACRTVAKMWAKLSTIDDAAQRAEILEGFYFRGLKGDGRVFPPVVHAEHYGPKGGQIRVNLFRSGFDGWQLRDFQTDLGAPDGSAVFIKPASVKGNPFGALFNGNSGQPLATRFQDHFLTQLESLAADDVNKIGMSTPLEVNAGQSNESGPENDYAFHLGQDDVYSNTVDLALTGTGLDSQDIAERATAMSCAGCHQLSNGQNLGPGENGVRWPDSLGFVHITELTPETGPDGLRHRISPALVDEFLPARKKTLENYLRKNSCGKLICKHKPVKLELGSAQGKGVPGSDDDGLENETAPKATLGGSVFPH